MEYVSSRDGTGIAFERSGAGPALVVVNGALSVGTPGNPLGPLLDPHFTLVRYDRRGRGASADAPEYAPEREIEDLEAVVAAVAHAGEAGPFVFGHSSGARLSLNAAMRGLPIERLAVNEPPYILEGTRPYPRAMMPRELRALLAAGDREGALQHFLLDQVGLPGFAVDQMRASPFWPQMLAIAHTTAYDSELTIDNEMPVEALARLEIPVLVTRGGASFPWIGESARVLAETLPNAEFVVLEGQLHSPTPQALAPELIRFFLG